VDIKDIHKNTDLINMLIDEFIIEDLINGNYLTIGGRSHRISSGGGHPLRISKKYKTKVVTAKPAREAMS
jgi:hypothetical protein